MIALRKPSHGTALAAGLVLIAGMNAIALGGVAWNRGEQDSRLQLTQRELALPYTLVRSDGEDPGVSLRLAWRSSEICEGEGYCYDNGKAPWLDEKKLAELGFDLSQRRRPDGERSPRSQEREVVLVLEFEGAAYVRRLQELQAQLRKAQETLKGAGKPGDPVAEAARAARGEEAANAASVVAAENGIRSAAERLRQAAREDSRLIAVDAGHDRQALRARYPDRHRYALVGAIIGYTPAWEGERRLARGYVERLLVEQINLPRPLAQRLAIAQAQGAAAGSLRYTVDLAFGRRLEPWIVEAKASETTR